MHEFPVTSSSFLNFCSQLTFPDIVSSSHFDFSNIQAIGSLQASFLLETCVKIVMLSETGSNLNAIILCFRSPLNEMIHTKEIFAWTVTGHLFWAGGPLLSFVIFYGCGLFHLFGTKVQFDAGARWPAFYDTSCPVQCNSGLWKSSMVEGSVIDSPIHSFRLRSPSAMQQSGIRRSIYQEMVVNQCT